MDDPSYKKCKPYPWKNDYKHQLALTFRKFELSHVVLFANEFMEPIEHCIMSLLTLEVSKSRYRDYFWRIKKMLTGYMNCCHRISKSLSPIETIIANIDKIEFNMYIIEAKNFQTSKQETFLSYLDSINADASVRDKYIELFTVYIEKLASMEATVENFNRPAPFLKFARDQLDVTIGWLDDLFEFAATEMSAILYKVKKLIILSLEDNLTMHNANIEHVQKQYTLTLEKLRDDAYQARNMWIGLTRNSCPSPGEEEAVQESIKKTQKKLEEFLMDKCYFIDELEYNRNYYVRRLASLDEILQRIYHIENIINSIEDKKDTVTYNYDLKREEIIKSDNKSYIEMELAFWEKKYVKFMEEYERQIGRFESQLVHSRNALVTFFCINGETRTTHSDENGKFFFDEFGRKIYTGNFGMDLYCVDKECYIQKVQNEQFYSYDCNGRLINPIAGEDAVYRRGLNNSCYGLNELDLMTKIKLEEEPTKPVEIPQLEKGKLTREDVDYLWEVLAPCLPRAVLEVCKAKPKNHAFLLAHRLITSKYGPNAKRRDEDAEESIKFRDNIYAKRNKALMKAYEAWKSRQIKALAPQHASDPHAEMVQALIAEQMISAAHQLL